MQGQLFPEKMAKFLIVGQVSGFCQDRCIGQVYDRCTSIQKDRCTGQVSYKKTSPGELQTNNQQHLKF